MSACRFEDLEAYVFDELGRDRAAAIQAHLASCACCAREVGCLRAERQAFAARASHDPVPPPSFDRILDRPTVADPPERPVMARLSQLGWGRRGASGRAQAALAMCSAMAVLVLALRATQYDRVAPIVSSPAAPMDEPTPSASEARALACFDVEPIVAEESLSAAADPVTVGVEDEYGACLLATPVVRPSAGALTCDAPPL